MPSRREMLTIVALVIADAAWLYPLSGLLGQALFLGQPLLPLPVIGILIAVAIAVVWTVAGTVTDPARQAPYQAAVGLAAIYLAMANAIAGHDADLLWAANMFLGRYDANVVGGLVIGSAAAVFVWIRGVGIAVETHPPLRLLSTFRIGIVALALAVVVEQTFDVEANAATMLVPFFVVCLAGLAFARMPPGGGWTTMVGIAIGIVLAGGFVIGSIAAALGGSGLELLLAGWILLTEGVMWLLALILIPILQFIASLLPELEPGTARGEAFRLPNFDFLRRLDQEAVPPEIENISRILMYLVIIAAVYLLYRLMRAAFRAHQLRRQAQAALERENIEGAKNAKDDLLKLALELLPAWMRPAAGVPAPSIPVDLPGITEVYTLYFDMLNLACGKGHEFVPSATPRERRAALERILPKAPVGGITARFNAACYGNIPTEAAIVTRLREELESAANEAALR